MTEPKRKVHKWTQDDIDKARKLYIQGTPLSALEVMFSSSWRTIIKYINQDTLIKPLPLPNPEPEPEPASRIPKRSTSYIWGETYVPPPEIPARPGAYDHKRYHSLGAY